MESSSAKILTHRGYSILKSALTEKQADKIRSDLTVCPTLNKKFASPAIQAGLTFKLFKESATRWYLPRFYGVEAFGPADTSVLSEGLDLCDTAANFGGTPYQYQTDIINGFLTAGANGLICVPCGKGKTFMALKIAASLKKRFLVIVDKEFLMNQWRGEMAVLMPGLRVGILQGSVSQIENEIVYPKDPTLPELKLMAKNAGLKMSGTKPELIARLTEANIKIKGDAEEIQYDCTICMIQTLCGKEFSDTTFRNYGFTIFDECHHLGAQHFSKTLQKVQTKCMLGLSATPTREDGLTKVFFWFLGKPVYWEKQREPDPTVEVLSILVKSDEPEYNTVPRDWKGEPVMARLLGNVLGCSERTDEIIRQIVGLCADSRRRVLVLSERIGHLEEIERRLGLALKKPTISYYIGGMKEAVREAGAASAQVLLASYAMASEAMNIKTLNTVILASPRKHVEQSTGRILRVQASERQVMPKIIDFVDVHSMYRGQWKKRLTYYRACAYSLSTITMGGAQEAIDEVPLIEPDINGCLFQD